MLAVPTYGYVDPLCARDVRVAAMHAANRGLRWTNDLSPDRVGWSDSRNAVAEAFLNDTTADGIMWVDSDMRVDPDTITRLLSHKLDFACGLYFTRQYPYKPSIHKLTPDGTRIQIGLTYQPDALVPMDACGFGFVWTSRNLIDAIVNLPTFEEAGGWFPDRRSMGGFGEDISFCVYAKQAGYQLYADTGILLGHLGGSQVITVDDFKACFKTGDILKTIPPTRWGKRT